MPFTRTFLMAITLCGVALGGCTRDLSQDGYGSSETAGKVLYGTVVSARQVIIRNSDQLSSNGAGVLAGGAGGGVLGSTVGSGSGNAVATVGGAIAGAITGAVLQDEMSQSPGFEYIVKLDKGNASGKGSKKTSVRLSGKNTVTGDMNRSIDLAEHTTDTILVVQADDAPIAEGTRVMVIHTDKRTRIRPRE